MLIKGRFQTEEENNKVQEKKCYVQIGVFAIKWLNHNRKEGHRKNVHYLEQLVVVFEEKDEGKQEDDVFSVLAKQSDECYCVIYFIDKP